MNDLFSNMIKSTKNGKDRLAKLLSFNDKNPALKEYLSIFKKAFYNVEAFDSLIKDFETVLKNLRITTTTVDLNSCEKSKLCQDVSKKIMDRIDKLNISKPLKTHLKCLVSKYIHHSSESDAQQPTNKNSQNDSKQNMLANDNLPQNHDSTLNLKYVLNKIKTIATNLNGYIKKDKYAQRVLRSFEIKNNEQNNQNDPIKKPQTLKGGNIYPYDEYTKNTVHQLEKQKINIETSKFFIDSDIDNSDIITFAVITFAIRAISLLFLELAIDVEYIKTFEFSLIFYVFMYIILFIFVLGLVNLHYDHSDNLFYIQNYLYYFYVKNYYYDLPRLAIHISLVLIILLIPFIIKAKDLNYDMYKEIDKKEKKYVLNIISRFSLIIWALFVLISFMIK